MERTTTYISVWFWPRNAANVPADVKNGAATVNTAGWGTPMASFVNSSCNIPSHFGPHNIVINLTFCQCVSVCYDRPFGSHAVFS